MDEHRSAEVALRLLWSLWSELGVPGPRRDHRRAILDPERLLTVTPWFARSDDRLSDLVFSWCLQHGTRLSGSRLSALVRGAHPDVRSAAELFLAELATAGAPLVRLEPLSAARPRSHRDLPLTVERPALLRLRMRALVGVGGRADLLVALLSAPNAWVSASSLVGEVGFAKRHVARILAELVEGTLANSRQRGNVREFRLANPRALSELVTLPPEAAFPPWSAVFEWMRLTCELWSLSTDRPATARVEVARRREALLALASELGLSRLAPAEWADEATLLAWVAENARGMADGSAPFVGGAGVATRPVGQPQEEEHPRHDSNVRPAD